MDANNFLRDGRLRMNAIWTSDGNGPASSDGTRANCAQSIASAFCSVQPAILVQQALEEVEEKNQQRKNKDGSVQNWQCVKFEQSNGGCKARLQTKRSRTIMRSIQWLYQEATLWQISAQGVGHSRVAKRLLNHEQQDAPLALAPSISDSASRKLIRRHRIANQIPVVEANNVRNLTFPEASKKYTDAAGQEQLFVLKDSGQEDPTRIVLFGKERNIDWSADMKVTYWDGSFSMTPAPFYQVYAILAERSARNEEGGKWVFPVMYALLMNKYAA
uniref:Uncharacterized protein n=1 Tax=Ditylenchus dipsaci TaxID=166011 RepID=A0A915DYF7_9BILA